VRIALFWTSLAVIGFFTKHLPENPVGWTPFVAFALASLAYRHLSLRPARKRVFGTIKTLRVFLPGLLTAAGLGAYLLERESGVESGAGVGFVVGAAAAVCLVISFALMNSAPPRTNGRVRFVCSRCGLGSDRDEGREPCAHCGLITRIDWSGELPVSVHGAEPLTRLWCPSCALERSASRGNSSCEGCGQALHLEFNFHETGSTLPSKKSSADSPSG
jgi:hypothetical protein